MSLAIWISSLSFTCKFFHKHDALTRNRLRGKEYFILERQVFKILHIFFLTQILIHTYNQQLIKIHSFGPTIPFGSSLFLRMIVQEVNLHLTIE